MFARLSSCALLVAVTALVDWTRGEEVVCPGRCICYKTTVRCMHLHLQEVPEIPETTTVLDLRFNRIRSVEPGTFKNLKNLNTLLLNDNHIQTLKGGTFKGLSELRHLYLYKNKIREVEKRAFEGMPKLEQLYLHYNKIEKLHPHVFDKLQNLQRLFLHENKIQRIYSGTFETLRSLLRLRLDGNALVCDCGIMWFKELMSHEMAHTQVAATCQYPEDMQGKSIMDMKTNDFSCHEPRIVEGPHDVEVNFGGPATFTCRVDGDPAPIITWMLNDNEIDTSNPKYSVKEDGSLVVSSTDEGDLGTYECFAKSPFGTTKSQGATIVYKKRAGKTSFNRRPIDQTVKEGETIQLECTVVGDTQPDLSWTKDDLPLSSNRADVSPEGTLTLHEVTVEDSALYRCIVNTADGQISTPARVTVNAPPKILEPPESLSVNSGTHVELKCIAYGHPMPVITWYKDGSSVQPTQKIKLHSDGNILVINRADEGDTGLYTCLAQSLHGVAESSGELRVRPSGPRGPSFTITPTPLVAALGSSVEIPCKATGDPYPALEWLKNGQPMTFDSKHKVFPNGSLRMYNITLEDAAVYGCRAHNENGELTAEASLKIEHFGGVDDDTVVQAVLDARLAVDRAVNSTISTLFSSSRTRNPELFMTLFRYPDATARSVVRAADIYENTLTNIRRHIQAGFQVDDPEDFFYENILSPDQLQLVAKLSGCNEHMVANCSDMCYHKKYRTFDGTCNNLQNPFWGAAYTGFKRILRPIYENGFSQPVGWNKQKKYNGFGLPPARLVSTEIIRTPNVTEDEEITHMVMQWGQFLDHDLDHAIPSTTAESWEGLDCKKSCDASPPCFPMEIPHGDSRIKNRRCMDFIRSSAVCGSGVTSVFFNKIQPREQINQLTAYIDGSQVYGFTTNRSILLRDYSNDLGFLRVGIETSSGKPLLPIAGAQEVDCRRDPTESEIGCFLAGDVRVNEQVSLAAMHTIWLREHNRIAEELKEVNPEWKGETLFNEARKLVGAEMQHITYQHWLPTVLGPKGMEMLGPYKGYNPNVDSGITNAFATAAFRFGHSLIQPILKRLDENFETIPQGDLPLGRAFFAPWRLVDEGGVDPLMRGMFLTPAKKKRPNQNLNMELTEHLFTSFHAVALDLASMNVQRSRDHGIPFYNEYRKYCNLSSAETFDDLKGEISDDEVRRKLEDLYGHPANIDIFVGGILEDTVDGAKFGPTFRCILVDQFKRIREGDRFWYENPSTFTPSQLTQIQQSSLGRVLCDNGDNITQVTPNVFILPELQPQGVIDCGSVPKVDLRFWYECEDCNEGVRGRRELSENAMENRMEGLEGIVAELQRTVKNLKKRIRNLTGGGGCRDHKGKLRKDGETWQKNVCTLCECNEIHVSCTKQFCPKLTCENPRREPGKCCSFCP